jgi:hypothetical protein
MLYRHTDAREFLERAEPWLLAREIENGGSWSVNTRGRLMSFSTGIRFVYDSLDIDCTS